MIRVGKELDLNEVCFEFMNIINDLITIIIKDFLQKRMNFSFIDEPEVTRLMINITEAIWINQKNFNSTIKLRCNLFHNIVDSDCEIVH